MPTRATKRGDERTSLEGAHDVLICGASFAGLVVARELAGSGADVLIVDRYEIGERQTSACGIPTGWLAKLGLMEAERQRFDSLVIHTPHGDSRYRLPWTFSTFDYRQLCELLWEGCDARFETAKVEGLVNGAANGSDAIGVETDRGAGHAPRSSSTPSAGAGCWPGRRATSRPMRRSRAGSRCTRKVAPSTSRSGSTAATCRPATAGPSRRARRRGSGSVPSIPSSTCARRPSCWPRTWSATGSATRATGSPTSCAPATGRGVFFVGDSAGHCLPLTAEGIRTALYFGMALGRELRGVVDGRQSREAAAANYAAFNDSHEWKFRWMLRMQKLVPRIPPRMLGPLIRFFGLKRFVDWSFEPLPEHRPA